MTTQQERFVDEYLVDYNGAAACRRAGYSPEAARQEAWRLLQNPDIKAAIKTRLDELSMSAEEAVKRLTDWGRGSFRPFVRQDEESGLVVDLSKEEALENIHLVKKIKQTKKMNYFEGELTGIDYTTEIELHDAKDAVDKIAKIRGLYVDTLKSEVTINTNPKDLTDEQLAAIAAAHKPG